MSIIGSNILAGASGQGGGGYTIENSLRLRSSASAYLSRTPATAGNRKTWTWSAWIKRGKQGVVNYIFGSPATYSTAFRFEADGKFYFTGVSGTQFDLRTNQVFRDSSAWYHIIIAFDTTQATASNRIKIYVNGSEITSFSTASYPTLNLDGAINNNAYHGIGTPSSSDSHDGYLTEVNFIDGQALDPSSFGEYNADTGVWQPVAYAGTYGTNGFYLPFSDATNTTTLVADSSGQGNDWTPNNISLTAGATYDSMTDTPTPYADGGNYCVLNPLSSENSTLSDGNLNVLVTSSTSVKRYALSSFVLTSGKWYTEFTALSTSCAVGAADILTLGNSSYFGHLSGDYSFAYNNSGVFRINGAGSSYGDTFTTGDVIGIALDMDTGAVWFSKNGVWLNSATSSEITAGITTDAATTWAVNSREYCIGASASNTKCAINFGQRPFAYTPPTGFLPLHTGNLPDSAIVDGSTQMGILTYTGTNGDRLIATGEAGIDGEVNFTPDLVWNKSRNTAGYGALWDSVRGGTNALQTYSTTDELNSEGGDIDSFVEGGTNFGTGTINASWGNTSGSTYVSWQWKAGTAFSNDAGTNGATIASVGSVNQDAGFSVVTYTGNSTSGATVAHSLGSEPKMVIVKARGTPNGIARSWFVYHGELGGTKFIYLDLTTRDQTGSTVWNNTNPSSTVFTLGNENAVNQSTYDYVAYCFAEVEGYSKMGKWQNNNSTDGTFVYLGFRPRFILLKNYDNAESWYIWDSVRQTYNVPPPSNNWLSPNLSNSEAANSATTVAIDGLSNGFKIRTTNPATGEISFGTRNYIYIAFAENPFKNSLAR